MVIISGSGKRVYAKYGCPSHRYRGVCKNALAIRQERLEEQPLDALEQRITDSRLLDYTLSQFHQELNKQLAEIQKRGDGLEDLRRHRQQVQEKANRIALAIADAGHSPTLLTSLASIEKQIADLDARMDAHKPFELAPTMSEIRDFVYGNILQLKNLLRGDAAKAKASLARHLGQLVLTPTQTPGGPVYLVSGGLDLFFFCALNHCFAAAGTIPLPLPL
jgi:hypothetical protein